jgi:hypothetical protein
MSPSRMPTRLPQRDSANARFTATVVLPTPPFTGADGDDVLHARKRRRPSSGARTERTFAVMRTSTDVTPGSARTALSPAGEVDPSPDTRAS